MASFWVRVVRSPRFWFWTIVAGLMAFPLWCATAYPRGLVMAFIDHQRGHYEVVNFDIGKYGTPAELLKEKYDVEVKQRELEQAHFWEEWYVEGYNDASENLLISKHGTDIFDECTREAEEKKKPNQGPTDW
jgi:hypothetical protein